EHRAARVRRAAPTPSAALAAPLASNPDWNQCPIESMDPTRGWSSKCARIAAAERAVKARLRARRIGVQQWSVSCCAFLPQAGATDRANLPQHGCLTEHTP